MDGRSIPEEDTAYVMPPFIGRNIVIFSDGTGQAGGLQLDEYRSNVYKLFRATRCGPDSSIDPDRQLAFYDPGLGSKSAAEEIRIGVLRKLYNALSSATGLGITKNIIDCYAALIDLWRPGDRIFLVGFSRGAYTVRCLGGVLSLCGIPQRMQDGKPLDRSPEALRALAREAVKRVYRHGSGTDDKGQAALARKSKLQEQRKALGDQFRAKYSSSGPIGPNVVPHFIGVWDTVAAVGLTRPASRLLQSGAVALLFAVSAGMAWSRAHSFDAAFARWFAGAALLWAAACYFAYIALRIKFVTNLPGHRWYETMHLVSFRMAFFDRSLNPNVRYARHALAIDEHRADFDRVPWVNDASAPNRELAEGAWFTQLWFAGNHSDIGGSYPENESRLSDLSLAWMATQAMRAGLLVHRPLLGLYGRHDGRQHDECKVGIRLAGMTFKWRECVRSIKPDAPLHPSVLRRFQEQSVLVYGIEQPYRPAGLTSHDKVKQLYL